MTFEVQQTRWDRIIRRVSGSIGPGSRVSETLSELFPVIDVERVPAELLLLGGTKMATGRSIEVQVASNFQHSMLRNPGGSNTIITITSLSIFSSTAQAFALGPTLNTLLNLNLANTSFTDTRLDLATKPVGEVRDEPLLVVGVNTYELRGTAGESIFYQPPEAVAVLGPGTAYNVSCTVANTLLLCSWTWRERPAEASELSL
ncbi:hypothetical protein LCGC14_1878630 [marine sediment metagenome]|uniref:Uncharacterized protein n=1 Tax=marine sediment metagenome TaxID=412755 RepID=A0A0F9GR13_9ZZZZ